MKESIIIALGWLIIACLIGISNIASLDKKAFYDRCNWQPNNYLQVIGKITIYIPMKISCKLVEKWDWEKDD